MDYSLNAYITNSADEKDHALVHNPYNIMGTRSQTGEPFTVEDGDVALYYGNTLVGVPLRITSGCEHVEGQLDDYKVELV